MTTDQLQRLINLAYDRGYAATADSRSPYRAGSVQDASWLRGQTDRQDDDLCRDWDY